MGDVVGCDARARARLVFDDDLLSYKPPHAVCQQAAGHVGCRPRREPDDNVDRTRRISVLGDCNAPRHRQRGATRSQAQKLSAGRFHGAIPVRVMAKSDDHDVGRTTRTPSSEFAFGTNRKLPDRPSRSPTPILPHLRNLQRQFGLISASLTIFSHTPSWAFMNAANSSGELENPSKPTFL